MSGPEQFLSRKPPALVSPLGSPNREEPAQTYDFDHEVFVIWRPWESCDRCWTAVKMEKLTLPEDGDYVCPHTRMSEYKELLKRRSQGLCEFPAHESTTLKNGVIQVSVMIASRRPKETTDDGAKTKKESSGVHQRPPVL